MLGDFENRDEALNMLKETGMDIPGVYLNEPEEIAEHIENVQEQLLPDSNDT
mgnify:CR=1 FL=1